MKEGSLKVGVHVLKPILSPKNKISRLQFCFSLMPIRRYIPKVMFYTAVARPRFDKDGNCTSDGNIGMWPVVEWVAAKCDSRNRPAGTLEVNCKSVDKAVSKDIVLNKLFVISGLTDERGSFLFSKTMHPYMLMLMMIRYEVLEYAEAFAYL